MSTSSVTLVGVDGTDTTLTLTGTSVSLGTTTTSGTNTGDQSIFSTIAVSGQSNVVADTTSDTLTLVAGTNMTITTNASTDTITFAASGSGGLSDADYGDITVSSSGTVMTIDNDVVTYAKMQNVSATDKLLGRSTAGAGDVEEIACTAAGRALLDDADATAQRTTLGLGTLATQSGTFSGTSSGTNTGDQTITLTGGVTGSGTGSFAATVVTNANLTGDITSSGNATTAATALITGRTEDTTPDSANDYVLTYDASATALKKVLISNMPAGTPTPTHGLTYVLSKNQFCA